jgi:hypothetical protein
LLSIWFCIQQTACKKLVEVSSPPTSLTSGNVYTNDATAAAVLTNIYGTISGNNPLNAASMNSISLVSGLSGDELTLLGGTSTNTILSPFYLNSLAASSTGAGGLLLWNDFYTKLYIVNTALERLAVSNSLTPSVKQQLMGEAKFLRAFFYFYLVNLYGDVPLTTSSDYTKNAILSRSAKGDVYKQVVADLKDAQNLLADGYVASDATTSTDERVRPNKWAATALLARAYLYTGDWANTETTAGAVISNTARYDTVSLNNVFLKNSKEAIWQLQPVNAGWNTEDARVFVLPGTGPSNNYPVYLSKQLVNSFESGDQRKLNWVNSVTVNGTAYYYPYKYKAASLNAPVTEYATVLRLGEQYLIRAEARAHLGKTSEALKDLNLIRKRAGLADANTTDQTSLLNLIYHERQVELSTEWGHRWMDLKRTGKVDEVMSTVVSAKGTTWSSNWALYPIPLYDITQNPNLRQNPGY